jgi:hypothetical protein
LAWLQKLPRRLRVGDCTIVHAAAGDLWRAPVPTADDQTLVDIYDQLGTGAVGYGHIHRPFVRRVTGSLLASATRRSATARACASRGPLESLGPSRHRTTDVADFLRAGRRDGRIG